MLSIRYGWRSKRIPSYCACGNTFNLQHFLLCPRGVFSLPRCLCRTTMAAVEWWNVFNEHSKSDISRVDVSACGFWLVGQVALFDVRAFNPTAKRYVNQERKSYEVNEKEKKKQYKERILQVKHETFTPLVMSATGGMVRESRKFYARLSEVISKKKKRQLCVYCLVDKKKKFSIGKFSLYTFTW